jgi:hypothetical protein
VSSDRVKTICKTLAVVVPLTLKSFVAESAPPDDNIQT